VVLGRIVIDDVRPRTPGGQQPAKVAEGERVAVSADIFKDGHDVLAARVRTKVAGKRGWRAVPMRHAGNDRWEADVVFDGVGRHDVVVDAWPDRFATWTHDIRIKAGAGQDVGTELDEGMLLLRALEPHVPDIRRPLVLEALTRLADTSLPLEARLNAGLDDAVAVALDQVPLPADVTSAKPMPVWVDRERALCSAWYELFPRSEGGFAGVQKRLPAIVDMGFDVVYLPPIHPIGRTARKGPNNTLLAGPDDPGSPWAIGGPEGGHTDIAPELGSLADFRALVDEASALGVEIALDYALQCSPDHPWVEAHPEWFHQRPDGSIKYAENPPKKYQDIYPINFWPVNDHDRAELWDACKGILEHWIAQGVRIFRVDNPHTKPMAFWEWVIAEIQTKHPDVLFLAEAFTRPKVMAKLAEVGFTQSYTYFTWRNTKQELQEYVEELSTGPTADYMRPNFWPNTPDILAGPLRDGSPAAFRMRAMLAATLVPSWGVYSGFELCENEPMSDTNEEYLRSEKYELKVRDHDDPLSLAPFLTSLNHARRVHAGLRGLRGTRFHHSSKDELLVYSRASHDLDDVVLCVVNLDVDNVVEDTLWIDLGALGLPWGEPIDAHDELSGQTFHWSGPEPYVRLDPVDAPGHLLHLRRR
jgi:starch synthase (maltosyl-transferring)